MVIQQSEAAELSPCSKLVQYVEHHEFLLTAMMRNDFDRSIVDGILCVISPV